MNENTPPVKVRLQTVTPHDVGQRIDNYLLKHLKGVPKTRIYKALRKGEVRVNGGRKKPTYHIALGDEVRIPPIRVSQSAVDVVVPKNLLTHIPILFEDESLLIVDKPSGLAVHGGTGMQYGLIEALRQLRNDDGFLELVHRLDRETSGCLMLAKSKAALLHLQQQLANERSIQKRYIALLEGHLGDEQMRIDAPLKTLRNADNMKRMEVGDGGQLASSIFRVKNRYASATLVEIDLLTGRMHQARAHANHIGHHIAGDKMYGDWAFNDAMRKIGLGRLFLHAEVLQLTHPDSNEEMRCAASLPGALQLVLEKLAP